MPRYYLNLEQHGELIEDLEGTDFHDADHARHEAIRAARLIIDMRSARGKTAAGSLFDIVDEHRLSVVRVPFEEAQALA